MSTSKTSDAMREVMNNPPAGYFVVLPGTQTEDVVDLATLFGILAASWKALVSAGLLGGIIAALIALEMRNLYRAETLIMPATREASGGLNSLRSQFGGIAALAGVGIDASVGRTEEWMATLSSMDFARSFIMSENLMPILFADRWDSQQNRWRGDKKPPTIEDGVKQFTTNVRSIVQDRKTGLITLSVEWYSPQLAARWANQMVETVNERLRTEAIRTANLKADYLNKELAKTSVVEMQQVLYHLIQNQVSDAMLANVEREYAFHVIDPAVAPEKKTSPKRAIMVLVGTAGGLFLGIIFVFLKRAFRGPTVPVVMTSGVDTSTRGA